MVVGYVLRRRTTHCGGYVGYDGITVAAGTATVSRWLRGWQRIRLAHHLLTWATSR